MTINAFGYIYSLADAYNLNHLVIHAKYLCSKYLAPNIKFLSMDIRYAA